MDFLQQEDPKKPRSSYYKPNYLFPPGSPDLTPHFGVFGVTEKSTSIDGLSPQQVEDITSFSSHGFQLPSHAGIVTPPSSRPSGSQHHNVPPQVNPAIGSAISSM